jgi:hypothetical protein
MTTLHYAIKDPKLLKIMLFHKSLPIAKFFTLLNLFQIAKDE